MYRKMMDYLILGCLCHLQVLHQLRIHATEKSIGMIPECSDIVTNIVRYFIFIYYDYANS